MNWKTLNKFIFTNRKFKNYTSYHIQDSVLTKNLTICYDSK